MAKNVIDSTEGSNKLKIQMYGTIEHLCIPEALRGVLLPSKMTQFRHSA